VSVNLKVQSAGMDDIEQWLTSKEQKEEDGVVGNSVSRYCCRRLELEGGSDGAVDRTTTGVGEAEQV
jgi:hypothetical protein